MFKAFKYRIFPTEPQKELIAKHIGHSRYVFNLALETKNAAYISAKHNYSAFDLVKQLPELKKELPWLKEVNSQSLQQSIQNMDIAFKKFFKGAGFPKFKSKHKGKQSFSIPQNVIVENDLLIIPKFKEGIKMSLHRPTKGTIKSATISVTPTGKYFVSILCDTKEEIPTKTPTKENTTIGLSKVPDKAVGTFTFLRNNHANTTKICPSTFTGASKTVPNSNDFSRFLISLNDFLLGGDSCRLMKFGYMFNGTFCPLVGFRYFSFCFSRVRFSEKGIKFSNSGFGAVRNSNALGLGSFSAEGSAVGVSTDIIAEFLFATPEKRNPKTFSVLKICAIRNNFDNLEFKNLPSILRDSSVKWKRFLQVPFFSVFSESKSNIDGLPNVAFSVDCISENVNTRNRWDVFEPCLHIANIQKENDLIPNAPKSDLGIKDFAITSEGEVFENPKYLRKAQSKLKYVQRKYSKHKGKRTKKKLAKLHENVVNKRKDFLHKVSTQLIRENQTIAIETLAVKNMVKNHNLAQAIQDASWSTFVTMLEYKADWYGKNILRIGRFAPSSKTCSCGVINKDLKLSDRVWTCKSCGTTHDRDILAACNIKSFALKNHLSGEHTLKNQDELLTLVKVLTPEAQPIASGVGG